MEPDQSQQRPCPRCGKARTGSGGSITQWITACNCSDIDAPLDTLPPSTICATCGKRQEAGRSGSFTQWVFRQELCTCNQPGYISGSTQIPVTSTEITEESYDDEEELEVNPDKFPIERYKPLGELGRGASGTVYLCRDRLLGTRVAVKVLNVLTSEKLVSFQNEAKATSRLNHKNIVKILDFGATESGYPYMVMERFQGESLEKFLEEHGTLAPFLAIMIFMDVADGLEYAHERTIFHRDIKPSNLLLSFDERGHPTVLIIDFGVAQLEAGSQEPTIIQGRTMVGSPKYMSPDQANNLTYDQRSEIYSVGCVLFEALSGRAPFDGETSLEIISKHANEPPPELRDIVGENVVPVVLEETVGRTLAKNPNERVQSMADLKKELSRAYQQETRTGVYNRSDNQKPQKHVFYLASSIALVAIVLLVVSTSQQQPPVPSKKEKTDIQVKKGFTADKSDPRRGSMDVASYRKPQHKTPVKVHRKATNLNAFEIDPDGKLVRVSFKCKDADLEALKELEPPPLGLVMSPNTTDDSVRKIREMKLVSLKGLDLSSSQITDACVDDINAMPHLEDLILLGTGISDEFLKKLRINIAYINLDRCSKVGDEGLLAICEHIKSLYKVEVSSTRVTTSGLKHLGKLPHLTRLVMSNMPVDDQVIDVLKTLNLTHLTITEAKATRQTLKRLPELKNLEYIEVSHISTMDKETFDWLCRQMPNCRVTSQQHKASANMDAISDFEGMLGK